MYVTCTVLRQAVGSSQTQSLRFKLPVTSTVVVAGVYTYKDNGVAAFLSLVFITLISIIDCKILICTQS